MTYHACHEIKYPPELAYPRIFYFYPYLSPTSKNHARTLGKSFTNSCLWRFGVKYRCNRPEYTPGRNIPGYIMA